MITVNFTHDQHTIEVGLKEKDSEPLTEMTWSELYQDAQNCNLPYYWLSINVVESQNTYIGRCYDGITLEKCKKAHNGKYATPFLDPLTRSPILKTYDLFLNCFAFSENSLPLKTLETFTVSPFQFSDLDSTLASICMLGLNGYSVKNPELKKSVGQAQFIVGTTLLNSENDENRMEAIRWIWSAAQQEIKEAYTLLGYQAWLGENIEENNELGRSYLLKANKMGDNKALEIIQQCYKSPPSEL